MARLKLDLLGSLQASLEGKLITGFESNKVRALLAYLAAEARRSQPREKLAGLLWPDWPQKSALSNLRYALADLRKNLGDREAQPPFLIISREVIQLNPQGDCLVDAAEFERLVRNVAVSDWQLAVDLVRGAFLEGFSLADCPDFEQWVLGKREYYQREMLEVLGRLVEHSEVEGEYERGLGYARKRLELEPWLEEGHQQVMRQLALIGQRSVAMAQYEVCKQLLEKGLGAAPSAETRRLYEAIRDDEFGKGKKADVEKIGRLIPVSDFLEQPRHNLPVLLTSFIGREKEIVQVKSLLAEHRLVTLTGSGGVGKTRLAIQVAGEVVERCPDGVWYVELASLADPVLIPTTVAKVLGLHEQTDRDILDVLLDFLKHKHTLLVLDNCEHILDGCIRLADALLTRCPDLKILTASREALGIGGEMTCRVFSLSFPDLSKQLHPDQLMAWDAVRLFVERARAVQPDFQVTSDNAPAVVQICQRLDGIPLALELAAARLDMLTPEQVAVRLKDAFRLLTGGSRAALERHQTLRTTVDWSYHLLTSIEKTLLRRLAVFSGGWTLEAAEQVCPGGPIAVEDVLELLTSLVRKSMATPYHRKGSDRRYFLLEMVRQYAREKLSESGESEAVRQRHLDYFLAMARRIENITATEKVMLLIRKFIDDLDNIRAAIEWAFRENGDVRSGLLIAFHVGDWLAPRGYMVEAVNWLRAGQVHSGYAEQVPEFEKIRLEWRLSTHFGLEWVQRKQMIEQLERLCARAEALGPPAQSIRRSMLARIGFYYGYEGDFTRSKKLIIEALGSAYHLDPPNIYLVPLLIIKTQIEIFTGDYPSAIESANLGIKICQELGDRINAATGIQQLGWVEALQGNTDKAKVYFKQSLDLFREVHSLKGSNLVLNLLGQLATLEGDYLQAIMLSQEAMRIAESYGNHMDTAWGIWSLAKALLVQGEGMTSPQKEKLRCQAAILLGATLKLENQHGWRTYGDLMPDRPPTMWDTVSWIDTPELQAALEQGQAMPFDEAVAYALSISEEGKLESR